MIFSYPCIYLSFSHSIIPNCSAKHLIFDTKRIIFCYFMKVISSLSDKCISHIYAIRDSVRFHTLLDRPYRML